MATTSLFGHAFVERLDDAGTFFAGSLHMVKRRFGRTVGPGPGKVLAQEHGLDRLKVQLRQQDLGDTLAPAQPILLLGMAAQAVSVGALDAMHPAGILGLAPAEKVGGRPATTFLQVRHFQGVEVPILGISDARLPPEAEAL
jgi:hypothetical protein